MCESIGDSVPEGRVEVVGRRERERVRRRTRVL